MMTHMTTLESAPLQPADPEQSCPQARALATRAVAEVETPAPAHQARPLEVVSVRGAASRCFNAEAPVDLVQEGANMLELQMRQSRCVTPLSISSKATQALLRQF